MEFNNLWRESTDKPWYAGLYSYAHSNPRTKSLVKLGMVFATEKHFTPEQIKHLDEYFGIQAVNIEDIPEPKNK